MCGNHSAMIEQMSNINKERLKEFKSRTFSSKKIFMKKIKEIIKTADNNCGSDADVIAKSNLLDYISKETGICGTTLLFLVSNLYSG